ELVNMSNDNIPEIFDVIKGEKSIFIIMDYIEGGFLRDIIRENGSISIDSSVKYGIHICDVITTLLNKNIGISGNIKDNIIVNNKNQLYFIGITFANNNDDLIENIGKALFFISEGKEIDDNIVFLNNSNKRFTKLIEEMLEGKYNEISEVKKALEKINKRKNKVILITSIAIILLIIGAASYYYNVSKSKDNNIQSQDIQATNNESTDESINETSNNDKTEDGSEKNKSTSKTKEDKDQVKTKDTSSDVFDGKLKINVNSYKIIDKSVMVDFTVENNYSKDIKLWSSGIYLVNENNKKFELDEGKRLEDNIGEIEIAKGNKNTYKVYFRNYEESNELTFVVSQIWCLGSESMSKVVKIKIK
ncbi:MAG: hypothetical protein GX275_09955, partial [Clostridiales bacterium]|nr:hypothetical protein [Clostridiales bacterium]